MVKEQCPNVTDEWLEAVVLAVNEEYVEPGDKVDLKAGDEVAFSAFSTCFDDSSTGNDDSSLDNDDSFR